ncbi:formate C-acetyltransferase [bacterium]|jgi:formate C-acetyltransferase|nr:formate C-acetyltransferase [bacterium]
MSKKFKEGKWYLKLDVKDFVSLNITTYNGDNDFLSNPTERTINLWNKCKIELEIERKNDGLHSVDTNIISDLTSFGPGYIDKDNEIIVGLQTDKLLKRSMKPHGGFNVVKRALAEYGLEPNEKVTEIFKKHTKTHNDGVFATYTDEIKQYRSLGILTGLPDNYARGRIIGDYRRVALYGIKKLIEYKKIDLNNIIGPMSDDIIRLREEVYEQIKSLYQMIDMGKIYNLDLSRPAENSQEAVQWTYMGYLAAVKEQDGAAMSLGNVSSFLDIYIEYDLKNNIITEKEAQEYIDQFVMKLRMVRHLRMKSYDEIFAGDPTWVTESIGGMFIDGRSKVTKTSYRFLHTLYNLGSSPEPNITILWSKELPENFKKYCAKVSIETSSIQYENDDLMRSITDCDDYGIACCVSMQEIGKHIQFFGARTNLVKTLLLSINKGKCENTGTKVIKGIPKLENEYLDYDKVMENFKITMKEVARVYNESMNIIHYMHDKYYYEKSQMSLIDTNPKINIAYGIAGLSIVADSLSAIKYAKVKAIRDVDGVAIKYITEGDFPKYGNDDDRVDNITKEVVKLFNDELKKLPVYKNATPTMSVLTITSNVMYGLKTGSTPDGRKKGEPFAPGANPMHGRDTNGIIASLNSVSKIDYNDARDGISNTISLVPNSLGNNENEKIQNLINLIDGYFFNNAQHLNINVLDKETLLDAMENPEKYSQLTIRVSGYAVNFIRLTKEQQEEVINRTFHEK